MTINDRGFTDDLDFVEQLIASCRIHLTAREQDEVHRATVEHPFAFVEAANVHKGRCFKSPQELAQWTLKIARQAIRGVAIA